MKANRKIWRVASVAVAVCALAVTTATAALGSTAKGTGVTLTAMIGSSGPAETNAVTSEMKAFTKKTGIKVNLIVSANLGQQLAQGFASGNPPDTFYLGNDQVATYAKAGDLARLDKLKNVRTFYKSLKDAYTYKGHLYAAPKDFSTLALVINRASWKAAHLTSSAVPTTWKQLASVAKKLTTSTQVGLCTNPEFHRLGAFMVEAGGWLVSKNLKKATVNSSMNVKALNYVKNMISAGSMKLTNQIGAGWGGEGFGKGLCAMTVEGNWIAGAMTHDYPSISYRVVQLPVGAAGRGTLQYDGGWGLAHASKHKAQTKQLIAYLTSPKVELKNAKAFGVMPSAKPAAPKWKKLYPRFAAFLDGAKYSRSIPPVPDIATVLGDFNQRLQALPTTDPKTILNAVQSEMQAILK
jgi:multiple sugar transport system substrate-binding protein